MAHEVDDTPLPQKKPVPLLLVLESEPENCVSNSVSKKANIFGKKCNHFFFETNKLTVCANFFEIKKSANMFKQLTGREKILV